MVRKTKRMFLGRGLAYILCKQRCMSTSRGKKKGKRLSEKEKQRLRVKRLNLNLYFPSTDDSGYVHLLPAIKVTYPSRNRNTIRIVKGKKLEEDVVSLLSNPGKRDYLVRNNGDKVLVADSIVGKHLLICCFKVALPNIHASAYQCRAMISAYSQLRDSNKNFEMVMVAKMANTNMVVDDEAAFTRFFEAFPCLAVPLWDVESRDFLCSSLGLTKRYKHCAVIIVDPHQVVLQTHGWCFFEYGASGFPYSDARLGALYAEDLEFDRKLDFMSNDGRFDAPVSLVELLGSDYLLSRYGSSDKISVSEISKKKCVALYLCVTGGDMGTLEDVRLDFEGFEFEIVLVHIPFMYDTESFVESIDRTLKRKKLSSWWVAPLIDEEPARRLWRLLGQSQIDKFMFLSDGCTGVELDGQTFCWELPGHYPCTRMALAKRYSDHLREEVTLESLLGRDNVMSLPLEGNKVLLYLDWHKNVCTKQGALYKKLNCYYDKMKKDYPDLEVVLVSMHAENEDPGLELDLAPSPWLLLPHADVDGYSVTDKLLMNDRASLVAFGKDGILRSTTAQRRLRQGCLFDDTLYQERVDKLKDYILEE